MQCPSCHFENMPNKTRCVACGAVLSGGDAMSFMPPRAGRVEKIFRLKTLYYYWNRFVHHFDPVANAISKNFMDYAEIRPFDYLIPGYPFWRSGSKQAGWAYFLLWVFGILVALLGLGSTIGALAIGLVCGVHLASIFRFAVTRQELLEQAGKILFTIIPMTFVIVYLPVIILSVWLLDVFVLGEIQFGPLEPQNRIVAVRVLNPERLQAGDCVLYTLPRISYERPEHGVNVISGPQFNRIIAVSGQMVEWKEGVLTVDGKVPEYHPLGFMTKTPDGKLVVPAGHVILVPALQRNGLIAPRDFNDLTQLIVVPNDSIRSRTLFIRRNLFNFVFLD